MFERTHMPAHAHTKCTQHSHKSYAQAVNQEQFFCTQSNQQSSEAITTYTESDHTTKSRNTITEHDMRTQWARQFCKKCF